MWVQIFFVACIAAGVWLGVSNARKRAATPPSATLVCPHCQTQGHVVAYPITTKDGISGAKATGAILTAGVSLLGTGLSRKSAKTRMLCGNCGVEWIVA